MHYYEWYSELNRWKWVTWPEEVTLSLETAITEGLATESWPVPELQLLDPIAQSTRGLADCLRHRNLNVKIVSAKAVACLAEALQRSADVLDNKCAFGKYFAICVRAEYDAIDYRLSEIERFASSGRIRTVKVLKLLEHIIPADVHVFRLKDLGATVYVTQKFVELVEEHGLTGFRFVPLDPSVSAVPA